jgi:hypothetical protein
VEIGPGDMAFLRCQWAVWTIHEPGFHADSPEPPFMWRVQAKPIARCGAAMAGSSSGLPAKGVGIDRESGGSPVQLQRQVRRSYYWPRGRKSEPAARGGVVAESGRLGAYRRIRVLDAALGVPLSTLQSLG